MKNIIRMIFILVTASLFLAYKLFYTESGLHYAIKLTNKFTHNKLNISEATGDLGSHFTLHNIVYHGSDIDVQITCLELFYNPITLLQGKLTINYLKAKNIKINYLENRKVTSSNTNLLLKRVIVKHADIASIKFYKNNILHTQIQRILFNQNENMHFSNYVILLKKGLIFGKLYFKSIEKWQLQVKAIQVDTNYLWKDLDGLVSFYLIIKNPLTQTNGIVTKNNAFIIDGNFFSDSLVIQNRKITKIKGLIKGSFFLSEDTQKLMTSARLQISDGQCYIPILQIQPRDITVSVSLNSANLLTIQGGFLSGGYLGFQGSVDLNDKNYPMQINFLGKQVHIVNTEEYNITASPELKVNLKDNDINLTGNLFLPYILIKLKKYEKSIVLPPEVEFANSTKKSSSLQNLSMQIVLQLGNKAHLAYKALEADLAGKIAIHQTPGGLPYGFGALIIKHGTYRIYDKYFDIQNGRLIYVGNLLTNPGLNIQATKKSKTPVTHFLGFSISSDVQSVKMGVSITGTLDNPTIELFSNPPMSQDDILSYIAFGKPRADISSADALSVLNTLASNLNSIGPISINQYTQVPGPFNILKMGTFNPIQAFNISLPINKYWRIQTETSINEVGADILYHYNVKSNL